MRRPPLLVALGSALLVLCSAPSPASAVEVAARLGLSTPAGEGVAVGPSAGLSLSVPLRGRLSLMAAADFSTHAASERPELPFDSVTALLGAEASIDLAPVVPVICVGPAYQYAFRAGGSDKADAWGGFLAVGLRATLFEHMLVGLQARYLTTSFTSAKFPAFVTFVVELGWTSGEP